ncbi:hypothetical protein ACFL14_01285 [Patescibacteria group bacterium]
MNSETINPEPENIENSENQEQESEFTPLNELISYGQTDSNAHIHLIPGTKAEISRDLYTDALHKLAEVIEQNPDIDTVSATSWIVARHPRLFEKQGFQIDDISDEFKSQYFPNEQRDIKYASMSREDFLNRFLKL